MESTTNSFDGFIAAVATEFYININKESNGVYVAKIPFEGGRSQEVLITLNEDESGDSTINYYSVVAQLKKEACELYKMALNFNSTLHYAGFALLDDALILHNTVLLEDCHPHSFMKSLTYIAAKADEMEELLVKKDLY